MPTLLIHRELHSKISEAINSPGDLNAMYNKVTEAFFGGAAAPELGSKPLIIMAPQDIAPDDTFVPNGRMIIWDHFTGPGRLEVLESSSATFNRGEYVTINLSGLAEEWRSGQVDEFYQALCNMRFMRSAGPEAHNFQYLTDLVLDSISFHTHGAYNTELLRADAQYWHEATDVEGFSFSSLDLDENYRITLTGGDDTAEDVFGTGTKKVNVKAPARLSELLEGARGVGETGGMTHVGPATNLFVLSDDEIGQVNRIFAELADGKIDMDTVEARIVEVIGDPGGKHNSRQLAAFKMAQYISLGAEQLGDEAKTALRNNPITIIYERLSGGEPIQISKVGGSVVNADRLYIDVAPYDTGRLMDYIFEDDIVRLSPDELGGEMVAPRFRETAPAQSLGEALHNIFDGKQSRITVGGIIDDMMGGPLTTAGVDIETATDKGLSIALCEAGYLNTPDDAPIISAGYRGVDGNYIGNMRRISEGEASEWRKYYTSKIERARNRWFRSSGEEKRRAWGKYIRTGEVTQLITKDFEESVDDIVKWVGGIYGTDMYSPDSMTGRGMATQNELLGFLGKIVQDVKGYDKFETRAEGLEHFMRMTRRGRARILNEWLINAAPWEAEEFFEGVGRAIDRAIDRMSSMDEAIAPDDFLNSILRTVTDAYDPNNPSGVRLIADVYDIKGIEGLYRQLSETVGVSESTTQMYNKLVKMERSNVADVIQSIMAVTKHYNIQETVEGIALPTSAAIDKLVQSGFLPDDVVEDLIAKGALWTPGEGAILEPHIGTHDLKIAAAIQEQVSKLLNATVEVDGTRVKLGELVSRTISETTDIITDTPEPNLYRFSWKDLIEGVDVEGERQNLYLRRMRSPEVTPATASDFGIDYFATKELNEGGVLFADDRMYPVGGRQTVQVVGAEAQGEKFITSMRDVVTGREHKIVFESREAFEQKWLPRYDVVKGTSADVAASTWEDVVLKSLDEHRRIIDEMITGESRTPGRTVNAPERLRGIFRKMEPISETKGVAFWDLYDEYKAGRATQEQLISAIGDIESSVAERDIYKKGMATHKILTEGLFYRDRDFWTDEMGRTTKAIDGAVTLTQERIDLLNARAKVPFSAEDIAYKNRSLVNIKRISDAAVEGPLGTIMDALDKRGFLPQSPLPGESKSEIDPDAYRAKRLQAMREAIFPTESEFIQLDVRRGVTKQEAMATRIRQIISSTYDVTDPEVFRTKEMTSAIDTIAQRVVGADPDLATGPALHTYDITRISALDSRIAAAERIAADDTIKRGQMYPLAQAIRDIKYRGSPTGILDNIDDPVIREFIQSDKLLGYMREMDVQTLSEFSGRLKARGGLPGAAAPIVSALEIVTDEIYGLIDPTNRGVGMHDAADYVPPSFVASDVLPARSYVDDVGEAIMKNATPRTILATAAILGTLGVINNAFVDRAPEKHRIKGSGYVTPSGEYVDDPTEVDVHAIPPPGAVQGRGFRMRVSGVDSLGAAHGLASGMRRMGTASIRQGNRRDIDNTNRKRIMDQMI
jgi:hypothetical protein